MQHCPSPPVRPSYTYLASVISNLYIDMSMSRCFKRTTESGCRRMTDPTDTFKNVSISRCYNRTTDDRPHRRLQDIYDLRLYIDEIGTSMYFVASGLSVNLHYKNHLNHLNGDFPKITLIISKKAFILSFHKIFNSFGYKCCHKSATGSTINI